MEEWKASFHDIYGRSPTAADMSIAPNHVKAMLQAERQPQKVEEEKQVRKGVKRKNFVMRMMDDEQFSPVKKRVNQAKLGGDENSIQLRSSPRKKMLSLEDSPKKQFSPRKNLMMSPLKSPIMSPNKKARFDFDDFSPMKSISKSASKSAIKHALTPIKSPTKRAYQRQLFNRDLEMLLMPTPEKRELEEDDGPVEEFGDETNDEVIKAKAQRPVARRLGGSSAKTDQNFQKINLRKKQFVRGKVTAEQKRKMKRKQMFRKKT